MSDKPDKALSTVLLVQVQGLTRQVERLQDQMREVYETLDHLRSSGELIMPPHRKWP